jgi:MoaA/NifB/PqqE/SkfB family radical SAM enzyme
MCDIWKIRSPREITPEDLEPHLASIRALGVKWIVFSGGEPLLHSDLGSLARIFRAEGVRLTLLTAGLLLERDASTVASVMDDVIVSLDGPPEIHDQIRRVRGAYSQLARGIVALRKLRPEIPVHGRCTVQKHNFRQLRAAVISAQELALNSLSFLAVDISSHAFHRPHGWPKEQQAAVALDLMEVEELEYEINRLIHDCREKIESGFICEKPEKLRRIIDHFRAHLGTRSAVAPRCNAPWVSAVIESDGTVRPCFFHRSIGNIRGDPLTRVLNSESALDFRRRLDIPRNPICRQCVCSLFLEVEDAG